MKEHFLWKHAMQSRQGTLVEVSDQDFRSLIDWFAEQKMVVVPHRFYPDSVNINGVCIIPRGEQGCSISKKSKAMNSSVR